MKRKIKNFDGIYRVTLGKLLADSGDLFPGHDSKCALCRCCQDHSTWAHGALLSGEVSESDINHYIHTTLGAA